MAIKNVGGHGTTSVLGQSAGQEAKARQPNFPDTTGPAAYSGPVTRKGGGLPGGRSGGKKSSAPSAPNKSTSKLASL